MRSPSTPKVQLDLTTDELVAEPVVLRPIFHPYSDGTEAWDGTQVVGEVYAYGLVELFAEKLRALAQRCRPRDLYDVVHTHRCIQTCWVELAMCMRRLSESANTSASMRPHSIRSCHRPIARRSSRNGRTCSPTSCRSSLRSNSFGSHSPKSSNGSTVDVLCRCSHMPSYQGLTSTSRGACHGRWCPGVRRRRSNSSASPARTASRSKSTTGRERGRQGPRIVSPLSFQRSRQGRLLLYVVNDRGQLRSYGVDRIAGVRDPGNTRRSLCRRVLV